MTFICNNNTIVTSVEQQIMPLGYLSEMMNEEMEKGTRHDIVRITRSYELLQICRKRMSKENFVIVAWRMR